MKYVYYILFFLICNNGYAQKYYKISENIKLSSRAITGFDDFGTGDVGYYYTQILDAEPIKKSRDNYLDVLGGYRLEDKFAEQNVLFNITGATYKPGLEDINLYYYLDQGLDKLLDDNIIIDSDYDRVRNLLRRKNISNEDKFDSLNTSTYRSIFKKLKQTRFEVLAPDTFKSTLDVARQISIGVKASVDSIIIKNAGRLDASVSLYIADRYSKNVVVDGHYLVARLDDKYTAVIATVFDTLQKRNVGNDPFGVAIKKYDDLPIDSKYGINTGLCAFELKVSLRKSHQDSLDIEAKLNAAFDPKIAAKIKADLDAEFDVKRTTGFIGNLNHVFIIRLGTKKEIDQIKLKNK